MMRHIGLGIKKISTDASYNSRWAFKEVIHTTLTPLGSFYAILGRAEFLDNHDVDIVLVLGKAEAELKVGFFLKNMGVCVYAINLAD